MGRIFFHLFGYDFTGWGIMQVFVFVILFIIGVSS